MSKDYEALSDTTEAWTPYSYDSSHAPTLSTNLI